MTRDRESLRWAAVTALLLLWMLAVVVTHLGPHSPYTPRAGEGQIANPDALTVYPVTRFFYDGTAPDWPEAHNMKLPLHSFAVATAAAFVRSYPAANYLVNAAALALLIFCGVRFGRRTGVRPGALLVALATMLALPGVVGYAGQPMHYVFGMAVSFLLVLAVAAMEEEQVRSPVAAGLVVAIFAVSYDPYVFLGAFILLLAGLRFRRRRDDAVFLIVAAAPPLLWQLFLSAVSRGGVSDDIRQRFIYAVIVEWAAFVEAPVTRILQPFMATHVGLQLGINEVIALVYWPLLLAVLTALWVGRPAIRRHHGTRFAALLVAVYFVEQLLTAAYDWENNPRRALPVMLAFAFAYTWAVDRFSERRGWRAAFVLLLALAAVLSFSDVLFGTNGIGFLYSGEAIRGGPKAALQVTESQLRVAGTVAPDQSVLLTRFPRATMAPTAPFLLSQVFAAAMTLCFFAILARAKLVGPRTPLAVALIIAASAVRFLV